MAAFGSSAKRSVTHSYELAPSYSGQAWIVVLSAALFFFFEFIQMNMFNAIDPSLRHSFGISDTQLGNLSAMYFYGNVLFLFPAGTLLDRFSTKRLLLVAMAASVICTFLFAWSRELWQAELCRLVTGLASTFCMLSAVRLASRWFPPRRIALVIGLVLTIAMSGGMLAQTPLTYLVGLFHWRHAVMLNSGLGVVFWLLILILVRDYPKGGELFSQQEKQQLKQMGFWSSVKLALRNPQNWLAGIYTNLLSFPVVILGATWGSLYLVHARDLTQLQSSYVTTMIFLGMIIGSPSVGWLSDFLGYRKWPMLVGAVLCFVLALVIILVPGLTLVQLMILFFLLGLISGVQVIAYPLVVESNSHAITTTAEGVACTLIMSAGLFQMVFGWIVDLNWQGKFHEGLKVYSGHAYYMAMYLFPVAFIVALLAAIFIKETYCKGVEDV